MKRLLIGFAILCLSASTAWAQRVLVIGFDGLGCADAQALVDAGRVTALARSPQLYCNLSIGKSDTQAGWAVTWTGVPPMWINGKLIGALGNAMYSGLYRNQHLLERIMDDNPNVYVGWIIGKDKNVHGNIPDSPHYGVYKKIILEGHPGAYWGDQFRSNAEVHDRASQALTEAGTGDMVIFAMFMDPDAAGHMTESLTEYHNQAVEADGFAEQLIQQAKAAAPTDVIFLSDHAFGFTERGDIETGHWTQDKALLGFDFPTTGVGPSTFTANGITVTMPVVNQGTFPRFLAREFGYDPDGLSLPDFTNVWYSMHGIDVSRP